MKRLEQILVRALEISFSICFLVMFALVVIQVALRYGFNESIGGANELATILFAYTSALGIAVGIAKRDHMAISWFTGRFPLKVRKAIDVLGLRTRHEKADLVAGRRNDVGHVALFGASLIKVSTNSVASEMSQHLVLSAHGKDTRKIKQFSQLETIHELHTLLGGSNSLVCCNGWRPSHEGSCDQGAQRNHRNALQRRAGA